MNEITVDFNNIDEDGFVMLSVQGALDDISQQSINLIDGLKVWLVSEDIKVLGIVRRPSAKLSTEWRAEFSEEEVIDAFNPDG